MAEAAAEFAQSVTPEYTSPFAYNERMLRSFRPVTAKDIAQVTANYWTRSTPRHRRSRPTWAVACTLGPDDLVDRTVPVRLAETALKAFREDAKGDGLFALGAAYYRAGRLDEAVKRLSESIKRGVEGPRVLGIPGDDHLAAGHAQEARPWIERLANRTHDRKTADFWEEVEIEILSREVETARKQRQGSPNLTLPDIRSLPPPEALAKTVPPSSSVPPTFTACRE